LTPRNRWLAAAAVVGLVDIHVFLADCDPCSGLRSADRQLGSVVRRGGFEHRELGLRVFRLPDPVLLVYRQSIVAVGSADRGLRSALRNPSGLRLLALRGSRWLHEADVRLPLATTQGNGTCPRTRDSCRDAGDPAHGKRN